jgi:hypothetical protein
LLSKCIISGNWVLLIHLLDLLYFSLHDTALKWQTKSMEVEMRGEKYVFKYVFNRVTCPINNFSLLEITHLIVSLIWMPGAPFLYNHGQYWWGFLYNSTNSELWNMKSIQHQPIKATLTSFPTIKEVKFNLEIS